MTGGPQVTPEPFKSESRGTASVSPFSSEPSPSKTPEPKGGNSDDSSLNNSNSQSGSTSQSKVYYPWMKSYTGKLMEVRQVRHTTLLSGLN